MHAGLLLEWTRRTAADTVFTLLPAQGVGLGASMSTRGGEDPLPLGSLVSAPTRCRLTTSRRITVRVSVTPSHIRGG